MDSKLLYEKIFNAVVSGGIQTIIDAAYDVIQLPIVVVDTSYRVLGIKIDENLTDNIWSYFSDKKALPDQIVWSFFKNKYIESVCNSFKPVYLNWGDLDVPTISGAIRVNGTIRAYIGVLCPTSIFKEDLIDSINIVTNGLAIDMANHKNEHTQNNSLLEILIRDLLTGVFTNEKQLENWKNNFKSIFKKDYVLAAISLPSNGGFGLLQYFSTIIVSKYSNVLSTIFSDTLFLLFYNINTESRVSEITKSIGEKLSSFNTHYSISKRFSNILDAPNYRFQVEKALELGTLFHPEELVYYYGDYVIPTIFSYSLKEMNSINYTHPIIHELEDFDQKNNTDYYTTLETYMLCIGNSRSVAEKLHIHRNTLLYRLNKISELTDLNFDDENLCFRLMVAFQMLKLKKQLNEP